MTVQQEQLWWYKGAARPSMELYIKDRSGAYIDFSAATFELKIGSAVTKTTGITGSASGSDTVPNVVVAWTAGELNIAPGIYPWQLTATISSLPRIYRGTLEIRAIL